ncbi:MAG: hypothetical protein EOO77_35180 [Oxalobacteraceae bacterium]|nr:MAG: hypothetical protein EOO77_35180 [Oxalobacteraceae bacterium]
MEIKFKPLYRMKGVHYPFSFEMVPSTSHQTTISNMIEAIHWCREQFGPPDFAYGVKPEVYRWRADMTAIDMASDVDATAFRVRWG